MAGGSTVTEAALRDLPDSKRALARLLAVRARPAGHPTPRPTGAHVPATPVQARMWATEQAGCDTAHVGVHGLHLRGPVDPDRISEALHAVLQRHESLRTAIRPTPAGLGQVVAEAVPPRLLVDDVRSLPRAARAAAVQRSYETLGEGLALGTGETSRFRLLRVARDEHRLLLASHLGVFDGWSSAVFAADLAAAYRGDRQDPPALQAGDVALWQQRWLTGPDAAAAVDRVLASLEGVTALPRPVARFRRRHIPATLDPTRTAPAFRLGAEEGATPFMTLLAALVGVLARRTGRGHVVVGTPVAGRDFAGSEDVIGQLTTVVPISVDCSGKPSLRRLLRRVRTAAVQSLSDQRVPIDVLMERLAAAGRPSPPWSVLFALHNYPTAALDLPGIEVTVRPGPPTHHLELYGAPHPSAITALLGLVEQDGRIGGTAEHNAYACDAADVIALFGEMERVLARGVADPDAAVL